MFVKFTGPLMERRLYLMKLKVIGIIVGFIGSVILAIADLLDLKKDNGKD